MIVILKFRFSRAHLSSCFRCPAQLKSEHRLKFPMFFESSSLFTLQIHQNLPEFSAKVCLHFVAEIGSRSNVRPTAISERSQINFEAKRFAVVAQVATKSKCTNSILLSLRHSSLSWNEWMRCISSSALLFSALCRLCVTMKCRDSRFRSRPKHCALRFFDRKSFHCNFLSHDASCDRRSKITDSPHCSH